MPFNVTVLTLFPEMFPGPLGESLSGSALKKGIWTLNAADIRNYATDVHKTVDDTPCGGGAGMVLKPDIVDAAITDAHGKNPIGPENPLIYLSPRGKPLDQPTARALAAGNGCTLLCGRYEGVDQRVLDKWGATEISLGDFVLSGGEIAALALIDACVRLLPGVVGNDATVGEESFGDGIFENLLEYPHYTRPIDWQNRAVPEVLLSGHHGKIAAWRQERAEEITENRRPDLWERYKKAKKPDINVKK